MPLTIHTIGHSSHPTTRFIELLEDGGVETVVDVRSAPYSRYHPQFNKGELEFALETAGIGYQFLGGELGGRPRDDGLYDAEGHVRYDLLAQTEAFGRGIGRLLRIADGAQVAVLCAEEDPGGCHRRLLVGRVLQERGVSVRHIRGDGRVEPEEGWTSQLALFDDWRSAAPVRRPG